jgi:hypothetical protein
VCAALQHKFIVIIYSEILVNREQKPVMISDLVQEWAGTIGNELARSVYISEIVHSGVHSPDWFHNSSGPPGKCKHETFSIALSLADTLLGVQIVFSELLNI